MRTARGVGRNLRLCKMVMTGQSDRLRARSRSQSDRLRTRSRSQSDRLTACLRNGDGFKGSRTGRYAGMLPSPMMHGPTGTGATTSNRGFQQTRRSTLVDLFSQKHSLLPPFLRSTGV